MQKFRLYTGADSNYFLALLNLLGSLRTSNENKYELIIYDLGLKKKEVNILNKFYDVKELRKLSTNNNIYKNPYSAKCLIFYEMMKDGGKCAWLDSGLIIENCLDEVYDLLETSPILALPGTFKINYYIPMSYVIKYDIDPIILENSEIGSGFVFYNFNFDVTNKIVNHIKKMSDANECSGWSSVEQYRNKGLTFSNIIRDDCKMFRHDQTVLAVSILKYIKNFKPLDDMYKYNHSYKFEYPDQIVFTSRQKNRIYYVNELFNYFDKIKNLSLILKNSLIYLYSTYQRNLEFYKYSKLLKYILNKYDTFYLYNTLDNKFNSINFNKTIKDIPLDTRFIKLDTFNIFKNLNYVSENHNILDYDCDVLFVNVNEISYEFINDLLLNKKSFYLRYKYYKKSLSNQIKNLIQNAYSDYDIFDKKMLNIKKDYDENDAFEDHSEFLYYHSAFHKYEYVELFFEVRK